MRTLPLHAVVIAGGSGTRFWPVSRRHHPKQLLNLSGEDSLLHATLTRVAPLVPPAKWWLVVGAAHADGCRQVAPEVPAAQILVEPVPRNTAAAIGLAAVHLRAADPQAVMAVLPADHHVAEPAAFCAALAQAVPLAQAGAIVTLGIAPTRPETGYGYIERGAAQPGHAGTFRVQRFCEKPDRARAEGFLAQGNFLWNAGIFVMQPKHYLAALATHLPATSAALEELSATLGTASYAATLAHVYQRLASISIDFGVMEKAVASVAVVPVACGWSDVGSWDALGAVTAADAAGNVVRGKAVVLDSHDCEVYASDGHLVGLVGGEGLVVVHTADATLVIPASRAQDVRQILEKLEGEAWRSFL